MEKGRIKGCILDVVRAVIVALICSMILILLVAVVAKYVPMSDTVGTVLNQIVKVLAVAVGCLVGFRNKKYGLILGLVVGLLFTVLSFALFSLISGKLDFSSITIFDFLLGATVGVLSGVLAVNVRSIERKPREKKARLRGKKAVA